MLRGSLFGSWFVKCGKIVVVQNRWKIRKPLWIVLDSTEWLISVLFVFFTDFNVVDMVLKLILIWILNKVIMMHSCASEVYCGKLDRCCG